MFIFNLGEKMKSRMYFRTCCMLFVCVCAVCVIVFSGLLPSFAASSGSAHLSSRALPALPNTSQNNLPYPSWWNGAICDTTYSSSSAPLGYSYRGVSACGPVNTLFGPVPFPVSHFGEFEWQCVELSMRFMYLAYGVPAYSAPTGAEVVDNYTNSTIDPYSYNDPILMPVQNTNPSTSNTAPIPGDIVSYNSNHTAVVTGSTVDSHGNGTLTVLEQNASANGKATIKVGSAANLPPWVLGGNVKNWLHHTVDLIPQTGTPLTKVVMNGTGFGANEQVQISFDGETLIGSATTGSTGTFSTTLIIPATAQVGMHTIQATGQSSNFSPKTVFYVRSNWSTFGFDNQRTHFNPNEKVLSSQNVSGLKLGWAYTTLDNITDSSPAVENGIVYIGSLGLEAVDASTGTVKWTYNTSGSFRSSPAVANGIVYAGSNDGALYAVDANTGKLKWRYMTGNEVQSSPVVMSNIVYFGSVDDKVYALNATTGALKWSYNTGGMVFASPAIANGIVYIGSTNGFFYAFNASTGSLKWSYNTFSGIYSAPAVVNGIVYIGAGEIYAFNASTGTLKWNSNTGNTIGNSSPAVANGIVYIGATDGTMYAIDAMKGTLKWSYKAGGPIYFSSPTVANGVVYFGADDNKVYALDATAGTLDWSYTTGGSIDSSPAVVNSVVYIGSNDDNLYAFYLPGVGL